MPACANITALNLMLKPILRMPADSSSGLQRLQRLALLDLVRREPGIEQADAVAGLLVRQRHIAASFGASASAMPQISACIGSIEFALASIAKWPASRARAIQALSSSSVRMV